MAEGIRLGEQLPEEQGFAPLGEFKHYYEFMSQIVDYDSHDLEKLSLYARHLAPLLREKTPDDDPIDLSSAERPREQVDRELPDQGQQGCRSSLAPLARPGGRDQER